MKPLHTLSLLAVCAIGLTTFGVAHVNGAAISRYNITIWNPITQAYPVTGSMDLRFHSDGVVDGYYHPAGLPSFIPITGGRNGDHIWLTLGRGGAWQLNGHFDGQKITGSAVNEDPGPDHAVERFGAPVDLGSIAPIYSFTATPG